MALLLNPLLEALKVARDAAADAAQVDDEVTVDDHGDHWVFEFIPGGDSLGGGARVAVAKDDMRILSVVRRQ